MRSQNLYVYLNNGRPFNNSHLFAPTSSHLLMVEKSFFFLAQTATLITSQHSGSNHGGGWHPFAPAFV
jgi:hypothetical protein